MPKRVLDGEAIWTSSKLAKVQPACVRGEYAWLHPLAGSNGVFEWDDNAIWAKCYAYARVDKTPEDVRTIGDAFERAKLLFRWQQDGKTWAYWVGSDKRGRLPRRSWVERDRKKGRLGPDPQPEDLNRFLASDGEIQPGLSFEHASGTPQACSRHASSVHGSGSGIGLGTGNGERAAHALATPAASGVCEQIVASWNRERGSLSEVLKLSKERRRKLLARIRSDAEFPSKLLTAVRKASHTLFLSGGGNRGWRASFDWFIANDTNVVAVLEGRYDDAKGPEPSGEEIPLVEPYR